MSKKVQFVDLGAQHASIAADVEQAMANVIARTAFILGDEVRQFEADFAAFCDVEHAIGVDSGTSALELALLALGIGSGDEVITAANTFIASALAITATGATPVLVDCDPDTYNIDPTKIEAAITERTKALLPVHLYGQPADMDPILEIARRHDLFVVEDSAQAHGARYKGRRAGSMGHAAAFSFYPAKNLGAYGDGGMVVTNDAETADRLQMLRNYGQRKKYHHDSIGFNRRLDTIQAAVLGTKLPHLDGWNASRRKLADRYAELLAGMPLELPVVPEWAEPVFHLYVVRVDDREALQAHLQDAGVFTGIHYPVPIHLQPAYASLGYKPGDFPVTEAYAPRILSLPMYPELPPADLDIVADAMASYYAPVPASD